MANIVFNIAKGRVNELVERVRNNDPANSAIIVVAIKSAGLESDATLIDKDDLASVLSGTTDEATNVGYARKTLTDVDLAAAHAPDDANDRYDADLPDMTWTAVQVTGGAWAKLLVCYDGDTTSGTDANILPLTMHDFAVTPDGSDITATVNVFYRAS